MNYSEFYQKWCEPFRKYKSLLRILNYVLTALFYIAYPVLLILIIKEDILLRFILVPGLSFIVLSVIRKMIDRLRPYEKWNIHPIIEKDTKGKSMPSRHIFSSVIISMCYLYVFPVIGIVLLILSALASMLRVIIGVHYPSDVIAGYCIGIVCGLFL